MEESYSKFFVMLLNIKNIDNTNNRKYILHWCPVICILFSFDDPDSKNTLLLAVEEKKSLKGRWVGN